MVAGPNVPVWDDASWTPLPALTTDRSADACVIGLGGSGLTLINELLARGQRVIGLDAVDVGGGAAGRNGGFLLAGTYDFYHDAIRRHGHERTRAIYGATIAEMQRLAQDAPGTVRFVGSKRLAATAAELEDCRMQYEALRADGWPCEWYEGADGQGLFLPTDGAFDPMARCRALAGTALRDGASLFGRTPVSDIRGTAVHTENGVVHAARVFVAVDGRLERVLPELAGQVRTARLQMLATEPTYEISVPCPVYYRDGYEYWQQLPDGRIAIGGFRDKGGEGEWTTEHTPSATVQGELERFLRDRLGVHAPITHRWAASAGYTSTGLPVIAQVRDNVWALGGYSGTGNVIGALAARAVAAAAMEGDASLVQRLLGEAWSPEVTSRPAALSS